MLNLLIMFVNFGLMFMMLSTGFPYIACVNAFGAGVGFMGALIELAD